MTGRKRVMTQGQRAALFVVMLALAAVLGVAFYQRDGGEPGREAAEAAEHEEGEAGEPGELKREEDEEEREGAEREDQPQEAQDLYLLKRSPGVVFDRTGGERHVLGLQPLSFSRYRTAIARASRLDRYSTASGGKVASGPNVALGTWTALGPGNIGGRTRAILIDPTDANVMYAAGVAGGVWKSTNGGASWAPLHDLMSNLAVSGLAMDPANHNVIYAGTGEGFLSGDAVRGAGIFKSTNAGASWAPIGGTDASSNFYYVNDIVVSPNSSQRVYAATRNGVFRSLDGGGTWLGPIGGFGVPSGGCTDLVIRSDAGPADTLLVACGAGSTPVGAVYRTTDGASATPWTSVLALANQGRTALAIAPSNQNVVYALSASSATSGNFARGGMLAVSKSTNGGASFSTVVDNTSATKMNTLLLSNPREATATECGTGTSAYFNQGWYDNVIAVDPADENIVFAGGVDLFRSDDGGASWGMISRWDRTPNVHADQHAIVFAPGYNGTSNQTMWSGDDGGLYKTTNARAAKSTAITSPCSTSGISVSWTSFNNSYAVTQFYDGTPYPNGTTYFGGAQDNGTIRGTDAAGTNGWTQLLGGDGGYVAVDSGNTNTLYAEVQNFTFAKSTNGGSNWFVKTSGTRANNCNFGAGGDCFLFITPFSMDASSSSRLFTGGWYVYRTTNGADLWSQIGQITPGNGQLSAVVNAPTDANRLLVGMSDGVIALLTNALTADSSTAWTSSQPRAGFVSSLTFDPSNSLVAYATYSTFGGTHVWKSTNGGVSWSGIDGVVGSAIPDVPVHTLVVDPSDSQRLYVGTDIGVFVSTDGGSHWAVENTGFANVVTEKLKVNTVSSVGTLFAFTHGRGAYKVSLSPATAPGVPTSVTAVGGDAQATVSWTTPVSNGGSAITGYTVTPFIGAVAQTPTDVGAVTSTTITGLQNGKFYSFKVAAENAVGTGTQSSASNVVPTRDRSKGNHR
jgi:Fibronectin type III domain